jgi:hypothetical protein
VRERREEKHTSIIHTASEGENKEDANPGDANDRLRERKRKRTRRWKEEDRKGSRQRAN